MATVRELEQHGHSHRKQGPGGVEGQAQPPQNLGDKQSLLRPGLGTLSPDRVGVKCVLFEAAGLWCF